jgi:RND family efflux transporter MFP subunit
MPVYRSVFTRWITLLAVLSMLLAGCSAQPQVEEATPTPIPTPVIPTKPTYKVQVGEVVKMMEFTARLVPQIEEELYFKTGGRVQSVLVQKGEKVTAGQILAGLESGTSNVDVRRAEINLEFAKMERELFIMQANKFTQEYPIYLKMKDYSVELAQLALDEINARVDSAQVKAPFDGTMMSVFITPDRSVEPYKSVMVIADLTKIEISADLTSTDLQVLQEGMAVSVSAVSGPATELTGQIRRLPYPYGKADPASDNEKQDTATRVSLNEDPATANLSLGDLVRVKVVLEKKENTLWLPPQAIRRFEGRRFVVVQEEGGQRRVDVKIGITSDDRVEITEGLEEGMVVIAP